MTTWAPGVNGAFIYTLSARCRNATGAVPTCAGPQAMVGKMRALFCTSVATCGRKWARSSRRCWQAARLRTPSPELLHCWCIRESLLEGCECSLGLTCSRTNSSRVQICFTRFGPSCGNSRDARRSTPGDVASWPWRPPGSRVTATDPQQPVDAIESGQSHCVGTRNGRPVLDRPPNYPHIWIIVLRAA